MISQTPSFDIGSFIQHAARTLREPGSSRGARCSGMSMAGSYPTCDPTAGQGLSRPPPPASALC